MVPGRAWSGDGLGQVGVAGADRCEPTAEAVERNPGHGAGGDRSGAGIGGGLEASAERAGALELADAPALAAAEGAQRLPVSRPGLFREEARGGVLWPGGGAREAVGGDPTAAGAAIPAAVNPWGLRLRQVVAAAGGGDALVGSCRTWTLDCFGALPAGAKAVRCPGV